MLFGKVCLITKTKMNTRSSIHNHSKNSEMLEGSEASNNDFASNSVSTMAQNNEPMVQENCQLPVDHKVRPDDGNLLIPASTSSSTVGCLPVVSAAVPAAAVAATAAGDAPTTTIPNLPAGGFPRSGQGGARPKFVGYSPAFAPPAVSAHNALPSCINSDNSLPVCGTNPVYTTCRYQGSGDYIMPSAPVTESGLESCMQDSSQTLASWLPTENFPQYLGMNSSCPNYPQYSGVNSSCPTVKLPAFSGKGWWNTFINQFENVAVGQLWSEKGRRHGFLSCLSGDATDFVCELELESLNNYHSVVHQLSVCFKEVKTQESCQRLLFSRILNSNETVHEFAAELKTSFKAFPVGVSHQVREQMLIKQFFDGLGDGDVDFKIRYLQCSKTVDYALSTSCLRAILAGILIGNSIQ